MDIRVGGKDWTLLPQSTLEHDIFVMELLRRAGLDKACPKDGEDPSTFAQRLFYGSIESGVIWQMLGALYVPAGTDPEAWTPELAQATGDAFKKVVDREEKSILQAAFAEALAGFFAAGVASMMTFESFSADPGSGEAPPVIEEAETTGSGAP